MTPINNPQLYAFTNQEIRLLNLLVTTHLNELVMIEENPSIINMYSSLQSKLKEK